MPGAELVGLVLGVAGQRPDAGTHRQERAEEPLHDEGRIRSVDLAISPGPGEAAVGLGDVPEDVTVYRFAEVHVLVSERVVAGPVVAKQNLLPGLLEPKQVDVDAHRGQNPLHAKPVVAEGELVGALAAGQHGLQLERRFIVEFVVAGIEGGHVAAGGPQTSGEPDENWL